MKYSDDEISKAVLASNSWAMVYRLLCGPDAKPSPGMQSHFKRRAIKAGADFSHFRYQRAPKPVVTEVTPVVTVDPVAEPDTA